VRGLFVTGTDTGVGKTILSASLLAAMAATGERVHAHKPVVTGLDDDQPGAQPSWPADHVLLAAVSGMAPEDVSPLRFGPAASPHLAARLERRRIDPEQLVESARSSLEEGTVVIEGVGGLLVPLSDGFSVCDLAQELELPVLIAARPGLGTINHTLLTLAVARAAGLDVCAVVLTPWPDSPGELERSNRETIARLGEVMVETLTEISGPDATELARAGSALPWRDWLKPAPASRPVQV
jgi:dethiobiotin synthetase